MSRKHFIIAAAGGGVLVIGLVLFYMTNSGSPRQSQILSDGSVLTVRTMTSGNRNRIVEGNLFQRTAGQLLPETWARKLGAIVTSVPVDTRLPVLWMERAVPLSTMSGVRAEILRAKVQGIGVVVTQNGTQSQFTAAMVPPDESWRLRLVEIRALDGQIIKHAITDNGTSGLSFGIVDGRRPFTNIDLTFGLQRQRFIDVLAQPSAAPAR